MLEFAFLSTAHVIRLRSFTKKCYGGNLSATPLAISFFQLCKCLSSVNHANMCKCHVGVKDRCLLFSLHVINVHYVNRDIRHGIGQNLKDE